MLKRTAVLILVLVSSTAFAYQYVPKEAYDHSLLEKTKSTVEVEPTKEVKKKKPITEEDWDKFYKAYRKYKTYEFIEDFK